MINSLISQHINEWGGYEEPLGVSNQNGQLFLAHACLELLHKGVDVEQVRFAYEKIIESTRTGPGLFARSPSDPSQNSHDNLIGLAALSFIFDQGTVAREILDQGIKNMNWWQTGPKIDGECLVRPKEMAILYICAGRSVRLFDAISLCLNLIFSKTWNMKRVRLLLLGQTKTKSLIILISMLIGALIMGDWEKHCLAYFGKNSWFYKVLES